MKKLFLFLAAAMVSVASMAHTVNNPIGEDGRYIVKYDMANHQFAASNDMEVDETFVFAVDVTGTWLENWLKGTPTAAGASRGVAFNNWTSRGDTNGDFRRLKQIDGNIFGMTCNFAQAKAEAADWSLSLMTDSVLYVYGQLFGFEYTAENPGAGWWMWGEGSNEGETTQAEGADCFFTFVPYTGARKSVEFFADDFTNGDIFGFGLAGYAAPEADVEEVLTDVPEHLYILGDIENLGWKETAPAEMTYEGNGIFSGVYTFTGATSYFAFCTEFGSWEAVNGSRFAGDANNLLECKVPVEMTGKGDGMCLTVAQGEYEVVVNVPMMTCTVFAKAASALENIETVKAVKFIENGQVYILKNGVRYNVLGAQVK